MKLIDILMGLGLIVITLILIPLASLQAQQVYVDCTPVPTFTPTLWANCQTATPHHIIFSTATGSPSVSPIVPTRTTVPLPTATPTLNGIFQTATSISQQRTLTPDFNASTAWAVMRSPTVEDISTPVITHPLPTPTYTGQYYVVTAYQGVNVRGDCRSTGKDCPPVDKVRYGDAIWVIGEPVNQNGYLWGKIAEGRWIALRCSNNSCHMVRDGSR